MNVKHFHFGGRNVYRCLNCKFIFKKPHTRWIPRSLNLGVLWSIDPSQLYYQVAVCPKCGSDAILDL